jgi:hypothetical protein
MLEEPTKPLEQPEQTKLEKDVTWVMERCPKLNTLAVLEPTAQAIAIMMSFRDDGDKPFLNEMELAKLSLVGIIAMHCRQQDEAKFQDIDPEAYLQVSNYYLDPDDSGINYKALLIKLSNIIYDPFKP